MQYAHCYAANIQICCFNQAGACESRSRVIPLETALLFARDEIAGSLLHESGLRAQFQVSAGHLLPTGKVNAHGESFHFLLALST